MGMGEPSIFGIHKIKESGNSLFKEGNISLTINLYKFALNLFCFLDFSTLHDHHSTSFLALSLVLNLDTCELKLSRYNQVYCYCNLVLKFDPCNVKTLYCRGLAFSQKNLLPEALKDFEHVLNLHPNNKDVNCELIVVVDRLVVNPNGKRVASPFNQLGSSNKGNKPLFSDDVIDKGDIASCSNVQLINNAVNTAANNIVDVVHICPDSTMDVDEFREVEPMLPATDKCDTSGQAEVPLTSPLSKEQFQHHVVALETKKWLRSKLFYNLLKDADITRLCSSQQALAGVHLRNRSSISVDSTHFLCRNTKNRKLQGEIDRVLKKVQEGVEVFDSIWKKVYDTDNANQKEKFEADLKKEIKKLQRYRDQIKTWIQSSEIKDKKACLTDIAVRRHTVDIVRVYVILCFGQFGVVVFVSASYEQALMDSRKQIEREMERFKICEKETKTKAFSKEGLGQQPKTDPKEKAKSDTRDWINNVVGELTSQIDSFEAEMEGLSVKKGKTRPPRLTHLEVSIARHKAHVMKLELILRLLENEELSPEQVNDVKDFLEDYVERNQEDFDDFSDVDELYSTLPLDKVEALEDLVSISQPGNVKAAPATSSVLSLKTSVSATSSVSLSKGGKSSEVVDRKAVGDLREGGRYEGGAQRLQNLVIGDYSADQVIWMENVKGEPAVPSSLQSATSQEQEETTSQESASDTVPRTPPSKNGTLSSSAPSNPPGNYTAVATSPGPLSAMPSSAAAVSGSLSSRGISESGTVTLPSSPPTLSNLTKEEESMSYPGQKSPPVLTDATTLTKGFGGGNISGQQAVNSLTAVSAISSTSVTPGAVPLASEMAKRNIVGSEERLGSSGMMQPLTSSISSRMIFPQHSMSIDSSGLADFGNTADPAVASGRTFPSPVPGAQWRPGSPFQSQSEVGQIRGRTEIAPDQREKFLQKFQQVQQQGHSSVIGMSGLTGGNSKPFSGQQQNPLLQQHQPFAIHQQGSLLAGQKDSVIEDQQQQSLPEDSAAEMGTGSGLSKHFMNDDDLKASYVKDVLTPAVSGPLAEASQQVRDVDLSPGQPLQSGQQSSSLGVIGRRSVSDLGAIGDSISGTSSSGSVHDYQYNLQMLEAAYYKLPQAKDSERAKSYTPRHPAATPSSYPQVQAPIVNNPAFWDRMGLDTLGTDTLFFAFYYQPNTYQQYLAAKELKKQSWRYHRKFNTWFQRHEEPKITTDDFEKGTYVYFDFHVANEDPTQGWCQRIKTDFIFEYNYLEDELIGHSISDDQVPASPESKMCSVASATEFPLTLAVFSASTFVVIIKNRTLHLNSEYVAHLTDNMIGDL
ncbi:hypothetical protein KSS87_014278 [Heliosperma pusillum]|nr:hypothetical protein KSS87_014278 [Heliosperma pusillum]